MNPAQLRISGRVWDAGKPRRGISMETKRKDKDREEEGEWRT